MYENTEVPLVNRMLKVDENEHCNKTKLGLDEACLQMTSSASVPLTLWAQVEECVKVNYLRCCV
jgi:hypothetical protein